MRFTSIFLFLLLMLTSCNSDGDMKLEQPTVSVAVSANMMPVMQELKSAFEAKTSVHVEVSSASSGILTAQIKNGAPFDVFLSADMFYPKEIDASGKAAEVPKSYARGLLILWTRKNIRLSDDLSFLLSDSLTKIGLPKPESAPYGLAAKQTLLKSDLWNLLSDKIVYGESVSQVNQYVNLKAVDVGFSSKSVLYTDFPEDATSLQIDTAMYAPILQGAVLLNHATAENPVNGPLFYHFLWSDKAQSILRNYGYLVH